MSSPELLSLRRKRRRICANLAKLEPMVADYHAKLASVEAEILRLDPRLWLPPRRYKPNPVFARQELPRLTLAMVLMVQVEEPAAEASGILDAATALGEER